MRVAVPQLVLRLALVGVVTVLLQVSAVIAAAALRHQRRPHAARHRGRRAAGRLDRRAPCFGFAVGLFLDLALVQTVGLSSLVYVAVGYWAGRLRELRDPQGALVPLAVGAAATAVGDGRLLARCSSCSASTRR